MKCQICGEEFDQESLQIIWLIKEIDDNVVIHICQDCIERTEEYLLARAAVCNQRGGLEADLAEQRKMSKKI